MNSDHNMIGVLMETNSPWPRVRFKDSTQAIPSLEPGFLLVRPKRGGIGEHWGAVLPSGLILEGQIGVGPRVVAFSDFVSHDERVDIIMPPNEFRDFDAIGNRARWVLARQDPSDLFTKNCEHTAMFVATGKNFSGQILTLLLVGICSAILFIIRANQISS